MKKAELEQKLQTESKSWWDNLPKPGSINSYRCARCGYVIVTIDVDRGVTPAYLACRGNTTCDGTMTSGWYRGNVPLIATPATYEWYRPDDTDSLVGYDTDHVLHGGLLLRKV